MTDEQLENLKNGRIRNSYRCKCKHFRDEHLDGEWYCEVQDCDCMLFDDKYKTK